MWNNIPEFVKSYEVKIYKIVAVKFKKGKVSPKILAELDRIYKEAEKD